MKWGFRPKIALALAFVLLSVFLLPASAEDASAEKDKLNQINRQMQQQRLEIYNRDQQAKTVTGEIVSLEKNMNQIEAELTRLAEEIEQLSLGVAESEKEIKIKTEELDLKSELLGERLCFVYEQGDADYLEVLLNATNMRDFLTRYDMINSIIENDREMIEVLVREREEVEQNKAWLEQQKKQIETNQAIQLIKKEELDSTKTNKERNLASIQQDKAKYEQALNELEAESKQLEQIIRSIQGDGAAQGSGQFIYPTDSRNITSPYGMRFHPILKQNKLHTGTDFGAGMGANMYASDSGTVIFSGWMNAYGQTIIIDHGNGVSTLYAHQSQLLVQKDQMVLQGDVIGKVGSTGWSTGPHAHFEIRINGATVDPMTYL